MSLCLWNYKIKPCPKVIRTDVSVKDKGQRVNVLFKDLLFCGQSKLLLFVVVWYVCSPERMCWKLNPQSYMLMVLGSGSL